jgi:Cytochrome oxidase complex assembly protein 1
MPYSVLASSFLLRRTLRDAYSDLILFLGNSPRKSKSRSRRSKFLDFDFVARHKDVMESTTPPLPTTPPPLTPQPHRNWWSRNWKWFVPTGCLTIIALGVLFVVCILFFVFSILKSSDVYKIAVSRAESDQRVIAALGTPIREGLVPSGKTNVNGASGEADIAIAISGPKGKATIYAVGTKSGGEWNFSKLAVQVDGGETIDLNKSAR